MYISGDTVVVGSRRDGDNGYNSGSAYVFEKPVGGWSGTVAQTAKLLPSDGLADGEFGFSVSIDGDTIVVGMSHDDDNGGDSGSAYVFQKPVGGWVDMTQTAKLLPSDGAAQDVFGNSVSISVDTVVVGAGEDDDNRSQWRLHRWNQRGIQKRLSNAAHNNSQQCDLGHHSGHRGRHPGGGSSIPAPCL